MDSSPCDDCRFRKQCAVARTACASYVAFSNAARWSHLPREPNRVDYLRAHHDLRVRDHFDAIAAVVRSARSQGRKPYLSELVTALKVERDVVIELIDRYKRKQSMTGDVYIGD